MNSWEEFEVICNHITGNRYIVQWFRFRKQESDRPKPLFGLFIFEKRKKSYLSQETTMILLPTKVSGRLSSN